MEINEKLTNRIKIILDKLSTNNELSILNYSHIPLLSQIISNFNLYENNELNSEKKSELIFVAAPTGAGKDTLVRKITSQSPDKDFTVLNMDMFRHYYRAIYPNQSNPNDNEFAIKTNDLSYEIYNLIENLILEYYNKTNIILTGTIKDTDWIKSVLEKYKSKNYSISLAGLAVPYRESAISIYERYLNTVQTQLEANINDKSPIRFTKMKYHDESFKGFLHSFKILEQDFIEHPGKLIDSISVYKRDKSISDLSEDTLLYSNSNPTTSSATEILNKILNDDSYKIEPSRILDLLKITLKFSKYLKSQNVFEELVSSLKQISNYSKFSEETQINPFEELI